MAYLKPQTPLKDLNSGDYFYPLTTIDQIITGTSRLSAFMSEDSSNHNLLNLSNIGNITGNIILNGTLTVSGNTIFDNSVDIKYNNFITFYGKNNNISPMARMGYMSAISGGTVHCVNASNGYQASGAFYIWSNGCDTGNGNGGIAIDNEGVTVFGAGDAGDNFTGVFRVINEDDIASGPKFLVQKNGHTFIPAHLAVGGYNNTSYGLSANSFICNGSSYFNGDTTHNGNISFTNAGTGFRGINYATMGDNDCWRIGGAATATDQGFLEIATADNADEPIYVRQYTGVFTTLKRTLTLLDASGNTILAGNLTTPGTATFNDQAYFNGHMSWKANTNFYCNGVTANNQEWSFDMNSGSYTGCYWHVWSAKNNASCLQCFNDDRHSWAFKLYGAVWNDYAEFRETKKEIEPGRCIVETGQGDLILSTKRMQEGCEIVSDTFGFAIGQSKKCNTPTAASGRVLAFPYENKDLFKPGKPVCSGPNGTISIMTEEEAKNYPWCIIGTVSEIPNYTEWQCGDEHTKPLKVNGRIWIRIR